MLRPLILLALLGCSYHPEGAAPSEFDSGTDIDTGTTTDGAGSGSSDEGPVSTPVTGLYDQFGVYPRAIQLEDGTVLAQITGNFAGGGAGGVIFESTDGGVTFDQVGKVAGELAARGACCATMLELKHAIGALPAGAILWSSSVGGQDNANAMTIELYASLDRGRTWTHHATIAVGARPHSQGGLWEPELTQLDDGSLVCQYSDETDGVHSQKLVARHSANAVDWSSVHDTVAIGSGARPGMATVRRLPSGQYVMAFELCVTDGCAAHLKFSADGWNWGAATDAGLRPTTIDGKSFRHAPTLAFSPNPGPNGRLYLAGQMLYDRNGVVTGGNGQIIMVNSEGGNGNWYEIPAPVPVDSPYDNFCPNYSSALLPIGDAGRIGVEIATRYDGNVCKPYFARGSIHGTGDDALLGATTEAALQSLHSGMCVDVPSGTTAPDAALQQFPCNGTVAQRFRITKLAPGNEQLVALASGLCLTVDGAPTAAGLRIVQQPCDQVTTEWRFENLGSGGFFRAVRAETGVCLDVAGGSFNANAAVQQWTCNDLAPQIWRIVP